MNKLALLIASAILVASQAFLIDQFQKPGYCPIPTGFGICVQGCFNDYSCPNDQKCCTNGCGSTCQTPLKKLDIQPRLKLKVDGKCPDTSGIITTCAITSLNCWSDSQCQQGYKCCPYGCGSICLKV